jgi:hypothetical protein
MVNTNYHKSINKTLTSRNYFDALQKGLLLCNGYPEHPGFATGIWRSFGKSMINTWNIWLVINKAIHSTAAVTRSRTWQTDQEIEETMMKNGMNNVNRSNKIVVKQKSC